MGDFNARIPDLNQFASSNQALSYTQNVDRGSNDNGKELTNICLATDIKPVNHMVHKGTSHDGELTFRKKNTWISQIDWALVSVNLLPFIESFRILRHQKVPTDHAPLVLQLNTVSDVTEAVLCRAAQLGQSYESAKPTTSYPIPIRNIDQATFLRNLPTPDALWSYGDDIEQMISAISDVLNATAQQAKKKQPGGFSRKRNAHER